MSAARGKVKHECLCQFIFAHPQTLEEYNRSHRGSRAQLKSKTDTHKSGVKSGAPGAGKNLFTRAHSFHRHAVSPRYDDQRGDDIVFVSIDYILDKDARDGLE